MRCSWQGTSADLSSGTYSNMRDLKIMSLNSCSARFGGVSEAVQDAITKRSLVPTAPLHMCRCIVLTDLVLSILHPRRLEHRSVSLLAASSPDPAPGVASHQMVCLQKKWHDRHSRMSCEGPAAPFEHFGRRISTITPAMSISHLHEFLVRFPNGADFLSLCTV